MVAARIEFGVVSHSGRSAVLIITASCRFAIAANFSSCMPPKRAAYYGLIALGDSTLGSVVNRVNAAPRGQPYRDQ
jgi:hypothetical protein